MGEQDDLAAYFRDAAEAETDPAHAQVLRELAQIASGRGQAQKPLGPISKAQTISRIDGLLSQAKDEAAALRRINQQLREGEDGQRG
jgi:hypothetical protein